MRDRSTGSGEAIRYLDKLIDELAKGKAMEKILQAGMRASCTLTYSVDVLSSVRSRSFISLRRDSSSASLSVATIRVRTSRFVVVIGKRSVSCPPDPMF